MKAFVVTVHKSWFGGNAQEIFLVFDVDADSAVISVGFSPESKPEPRISTTTTVYEVPIEPGVHLIHRFDP